MGQQDKINLNFTGKNMEVYTFLKGLEHTSIIQYVCDAVQEKRQHDQQKIPEYLKDYIDQRIDQKLQSLPVQQEQPSGELVEIDEAVKELILSEED